MKAAKYEDFPAAGGQRGDGLVENLDFLDMGGGLGRIGLLFYQGQVLDIPYAVCRRDQVVSGEVEGGVAGGDEKIGADLLKPPRDLGAQQSSVGLLDQVIHVGQSLETPAQISSQSRFVRLHLRAKPLRMISGLKPALR